MLPYILSLIVISYLPIGVDSQSPPDLIPLQSNNWATLSDTDFQNAKNLDSRWFNAFNQSAGRAGSSPVRPNWSCDSGAIDPMVNRRANVFQQRQLWPKGRPIMIAIHKSYNPLHRSIIARAIQEYNQKFQGCLQFTNWDGKSSGFIWIYPGSLGCHSPIGVQLLGREQYNPVSLKQDGCVFVESVEHEIMHSLGFFHEHQRYDRDKYINIIKENVDPQQYQVNFANLRPGFQEIGQYDYTSIMQYPEIGFSKDGRSPTMQAKDRKFQHVLGKSPTFSQGDIFKIKTLYKCQ